MKIESITIKNIRGFHNETIELNMIPNKPSLLVAPNGSGKSSFAIAFKNLINRDKLKLEEEDLYQCSSINSPKISLKIKLEDLVFELCADSNKNDIINWFDIAVINNKVKAKISKRNLGGNNDSKIEQSIEPIILIDKLPQKQGILFDIKSYGVKLGPSIIPDIRNLLRHNDTFYFFPFKEISLTKELYNKLDNIIDALKEYNGSTKKAEEIRQGLYENILPKIKNVLEIQKIVTALRNIDDCKDDTELNVQLKAMQLLSAYKTKTRSFQQNRKYAVYERKKQSQEDIYRPIETWQKIAPKEYEGKLILEIPHADRISNGERDMIVFLAMLENARISLNEQFNILVIDEIFDYLDDANLVVAQYYISKLIEEFKREGKKLFPIILTHLNPSYYENYLFSDLKVYYLKQLPHPHKSDLMISLLKERKIKDGQENISKYMLHYHNDYSTSMSFSKKKLNDAGWNDIPTFKRYCSNQMLKYLKKESFCPLAVCVMLREMIEKYCYELLKSEKDKEEFFKIHTTKEKLLLVKRKSSKVPEVFFLLGMIYNDALHYDAEKDIRQTLYSRLQNNTIMKMICDVAKITKYEGLANLTF